MLPKVLVKVVQIAVGVAVGNLTSEVIDKATVGIKKVVKKHKEEEAQQ